MPPKYGLGLLSGRQVRIWSRTSRGSFRRFMIYVTRAQLRPVRRPSPAWLLPPLGSISSLKPRVVTKGWGFRGLKCCGSSPTSLLGSEVGFRLNVPVKLLKLPRTGRHDKLTVGKESESGCSCTAPVLIMPVRAVPRPLVGLPPVTAYLRVLSHDVPRCYDVDDGPA